MNDQLDRRTAVTIGAIVVGFGVLFPILAVLLGYWYFDVSLPTLMFISFLLLFLGIICYPFGLKADPPIGAPSEDPRSGGSILLMLGMSSGFGVLVVFLVRWWKLGILFTWM